MVAREKRERRKARGGAPGEQSATLLLVLEIGRRRARGKERDAAADGGRRQGRVEAATSWLADVPVWSLSCPSVIWPEQRQQWWWWAAAAATRPRAGRPRLVVLAAARARLRQLRGAAWPLQSLESRV